MHIEYDKPTPTPDKPLVMQLFESWIVSQPQYTLLKIGEVDNRLERNAKGEYVVMAIQLAYMGFSAGKAFNDLAKAMGGAAQQMEKCVDFMQKVKIEVPEIVPKDYTYLKKPVNMDAIPKDLPPVIQQFMAANGRSLMKGDLVDKISVSGINYSLMYSHHVGELNEHTILYCVASNGNEVSVHIKDVVSVTPTQIMDYWQYAPDWANYLLLDDMGRGIWSAGAQVWSNRKWVSPDRNMRYQTHSMLFFFTATVGGLMWQRPNQE